MKKVSLEAMDILERVTHDRSSDIKEVENMEQKMDDMTEEYRNNQLEAYAPRGMFRGGGA